MQQVLTNITPDLFENINQENYERIVDAKKSTENLIQECLKSLKIISNKAILLLAYEGSIVATCFNKLIGVDKITWQFWVELSLLLYFAVLFIYTSQIIKPSQAHPPFLFANELIAPNLNELSKYEFEFYILSELNRSLINNMKVANTKQEKFNKAIDYAFKYPVLFFVSICIFYVLL